MGQKLNRNQANKNQLRRRKNKNEQKERTWIKAKSPMEQNQHLRLCPPPVSTPKRGSSPRTTERSEQNELKEDDMPLSQLAAENSSRFANKLEM